MLCFSCHRRNSFVGTIVRSVSGVFTRPPTPELVDLNPPQVFVREYDLRPIARVSYAESDTEDEEVPQMKNVRSKRAW